MISGTKTHETFSAEHETFWAWCFVGLIGFEKDACTSKNLPLDTNCQKVIWSKIHSVLNKKNGFEILIEWSVLKSFVNWKSFFAKKFVFLHESKFLKFLISGFLKMKIFKNPSKQRKIFKIFLFCNSISYRQFLLLMIDLQQLAVFVFFPHVTRKNEHKREKLFKWTDFSLIFALLFVFVSNYLFVWIFLTIPPLFRFQKFNFGCHIFNSLRQFSENIYNLKFLCKHYINS